MKFIFNIFKHNIRSVMFLLWIPVLVLFICPGLSAGEIITNAGSDYILENENIKVVLTRDKP